MVLIRECQQLAVGVAALALISGPLQIRAEAAPEFQITFDPKVSSAPFTGRVYVMLSKRRISEPPAGPNWFSPEPFFAREIKDWKSGIPISIGSNAFAFPTPLSKLARGTYWAVAIMDYDRGERSFSDAEGNAYSQPVLVDLDPAASGPSHLTIDRIVPPRPFLETDRVKLVELESRLLSEFHGRKVRMRASVILPKSYTRELSRAYPTVYMIPGFGGTHSSAHFMSGRGASDIAGTEVLYIVLDPSCSWGHHVFADSETNGPRGRALVDELIPHIERRFRAIPQPEARLLTGHSSGGWSSLWLQVTYPDFFGGVWSTAPDPVDFRDFQRINLYRPGVNLFFDEEGKPRPLARRGGKPILYVKSFYEMETVMGHGGQLFSFEAVFGPRGKDGKPTPLIDRATGSVDGAVAKSWERYDIRLVLERNWQKLGPKLRGKIHVYTGSEDTFYLEGAVVLLKEALARLGSDAVIEIFPGKDHGSLMDGALRTRIAKEMADSVRRGEPSIR